MEQRYVSTAISDLVLAVVSFGCACNSTLLRLSSHTVFGFVLVGIAASFGVLRFGVVLPSYHNVVIKIHGYLSWFASIVGVPLIAAGFCFHHLKQSLGNLHLASAGAGFMLSFVPTSLNKNLSKLVSTFAVVGIIFVSIVDKNMFGICGCIAYIAAGGLEPIDRLFGLRGVDWFHYVLAVGNVFFMCGITLVKAS
ncbi:uncharacterized protein LOC116305419 isoform X2 [Actinia tenebrosa]|uniref:Uncharacterized protein LOC116305419 isoform X2 n=1 Tax=Actinia tenebrosa TaxID=6105 RepID=A0A6P8IVQ6_ACTTE|nr:uncharacterized protein LOC116305419 isoform X2 [Actinia tenebrosa]